MTLIQPKTISNIFGHIIIALALVLLTGVAMLIVAYNQTVSLRHGVVNAKEDMKRIHAQNAELKDNVFNILSTVHLEDVAQGRNLVKEQQPRYLEVGQRQQWAFVSGQ